MLERGKNPGNFKRNQNIMVRNLYILLLYLRNKHLIISNDNIYVMMI